MVGKPVYNATFSLGPRKTVAVDSIIEHLHNIIRYHNGMKNLSAVLM